MSEQPENLTESDAPFPWQRAIHTALLLALEGGSLTLGSNFIRLPQLAAFLESNTASAEHRSALARGVVIGVLLPLVTVCLALLTRRARAVEALSRLADLCSPLILFALLPPLFRFQLWHRHPLVFLCLLAGSALSLEVVLRRFLAAQPVLLWARVREALAARVPGLSRWLPLLLVGLGSLSFALYTGHITSLRLNKFLSGSLDLGIYDNLMYNALKGQLFRAPILMGPEGGSYIAGHAEFAMLLFVPVYALRPDAHTLLWLQAVLLGFAAVPLYLFASTQVSRWTALLLAFAYLLYAPLHGAQYYDFHWLTVTVFFHFWLFFGIATRRTWLVVLMVLILFALREDVAVGLAVLGFFLLVTGQRPKLGAILAVVSTAWFALDKFYIMPAAGTWWFENIYKDLIAPGEEGYRSILTTLLSNPVFLLSTVLTEAKLLFSLHMLVPFIFLPVRRPYLALLILPGFIFTLMTTGYPATLNIGFQYVAHWIPYMFAACTIFLRIVRQERGPVQSRATTVALVFAIVCHSFVFGAILHKGAFGGNLRAMTTAQSERYQQMRRLAAMIPRDASVAATDPETPHLSARVEIYSLYYHKPPTDYLLVERDSVNVGNVRAHLSDVLQHEKYRLVASEGTRYYLFKRGPGGPETRQAAKSLGIEHIAGEGGE